MWQRREITVRRQGKYYKNLGGPPKKTHVGGSSSWEDEFVVIDHYPAQQTGPTLKSSPTSNRSGEQNVPQVTVRSLFDTEEAPLLRYAFSLLGRRAVAEEIVQEVFLQLHMRWEQIESPRSWLFRSVRNRAFNYLRDHRRDAPGDHDQGDQSTCIDEESPEASILRMEATATIRRLLMEVDQIDQQLITLRYFEGLNYREISNKTGLSIGNVGYRLHQVLKELAEKLRPLGIDEIS